MQDCTGSQITPIMLPKRGPGASCSGCLQVKKAAQRSNMRTQKSSHPAALQLAGVGPPRGGLRTHTCFTFPDCTSLSIRERMRNGWAVLGRAGRGCAAACIGAEGRGAPATAASVELAPPHVHVERPTLGVPSWRLVSVQAGVPLKSTCLPWWLSCSPQAAEGTTV